MTKLFLPHRDGKIGQSVREKDVIFLLAWSNTAQAIRCVLSLRPASGGEPVPIVIDLTVTSNRLVSSASVVVQQDGEIDGGSIGSVGPGSLTQRGMCYAQVAQQGARAHIFMAGYVYSGHAPRWGEIEEPGPAGGDGHKRAITSTDPAANAEIPVLTVPTGAKWLTKSYTVQLVQGITQTPLPSLKFTDGGTGSLMVQIPAMTTALGASTTAQLTWAEGLVQESFVAVVGDEQYTAPLPARLYLVATDTIGTVTDGLGANTNYGAALLIVEEWVMPN